MIPILIWDTLSSAQRRAALGRPAMRRSQAVTSVVTDIIDRVRREGDRALGELTRELDGVEAPRLRVAAEELAAAGAALTEAQRAALSLARDNIERFHRAQVRAPERVETAAGVVCERLSVPLAAVGLYAPAGSAPLVSTVLMLAIPAALAGCPRRVLCTPPGPDGRAHPAILAAAELCGVEEVYAVGGAQAIAALAYGTETVPKTVKIFGPGNAYVTAAKRAVALDPDGAAIDLPAGPSEVMVVADDTANPQWVAADLLSQAEHDADSQVLLVSDSRALLEAVARALPGQLRKLARRDTAGAALAQARLLLSRDTATALEIANRYAPEHLILHLAEPRTWLGRVSSAGSVFLGPWSPEAVGDYCSGTNHVLPTYGWARSHGGLSVDDFLRGMTVQTLSAAGLRRIGPAAVELARLEGLDAHARAIELRLESSAGRSAA